MVPKGGLEPPRVTSHAPQTCASASSATSACWVAIILLNPYLPFGFGELLLEAGDDAFAGAVVAAGDGCWVGAGVGVAVGALSGADCKTDREPFNDASESVNAINMKAAAAPMVIFDSRLAVPRGPNAVLDKLLEKSAPASALPGCRRITTIRMKQVRIKSPYNI
jgi:hypothetical protein